MNPVKCDAKGNLYVRTGGLGRAPLAAPVMKITSDGKHTALFSLDSVPDFEPKDFPEFAVDQQGRVYLAAIRSPDEVVLVSFDAEGQYRSTIKLEALLDPAQLAVFLSGQFLVSGWKVDANRDYTGEPFAAIFDRTGRLVKELSLSRGIRNAQADSGKDTKNQSAAGSIGLPGTEFDRAISFGRAQAAEDGNIYLMHATSSPIVYAVSSSGEVLRRVEVDPPAEGSRAITMHVAGGKLAVLFAIYSKTGQFKEHVISVSNAETGETLALYPSSPGMGGALACYTPNAFVFLGAGADGQLVVRSTYPP